MDKRHILITTAIFLLLNDERMLVVVPKDMIAEEIEVTSLREPCWICLN